MSHVISFPVLAIVIAAYLLMASGGGMLLDGDAYTMTLASGTEMTLRGSDFLVIAGLAALAIDLLKMGRGGAVGHALRAVTFIAALACFLLLGFAASVSFLLLCLIALTELVAGFARGRRA